MDFSEYLLRHTTSSATNKGRRSAQHEGKRNRAFTSEVHESVSLLHSLGSPRGEDRMQARMSFNIMSCVQMLADASVALKIGRLAIPSSKWSGCSGTRELPSTYVSTLTHPQTHTHTPAASACAGSCMRIAYTETTKLLRPLCEVSVINRVSAQRAYTLDFLIGLSLDENMILTHYIRILPI